MNTTAEQAANVLTEYDFIVCIDCSASMGDPAKASNPSRSRWEAVQESAIAFTRDLEKLDSDGIDVVLFGGSQIETFQGVTTDKVREAFSNRQPRGGTPLTEALTAALKLAGKSDKKDFIIVFTDGIPDDKTSAAKVIKDQANKQSADDECTILFVQVGDDAGAAKYLRMLDDDLKGAKFDIVDAKTLEEAEKFASTAELVIHAIND